MVNVGMFVLFRYLSPRSKQGAKVTSNIVERTKWRCAGERIATQELPWDDNDKKRWLQWR